MNIVENRGEKVKYKLLTILTIITLHSCKLDLFNYSVDISGTVINYQSNIKIGVFDELFGDKESYNGTDDSTEKDIVYFYIESSKKITTGQFTPIKQINLLNNGSYRIHFPDPSESRLEGYIIAWIDTDNDNIFDLGTEQGYFPVKTIDNVTCYVRDVYAYSPGMLSFSEYYVSIISFEPSYSSYNAIVTDIGEEGFNFIID